MPSESMGRFSCLDAAFLYTTALLYRCKAVSADTYLPSGQPVTKFVSLLARLGFWPYILLFTLLAIIISELLILAQSYWLTGTYFDRNLLIAGFITPAVDGFIVIFLTALMIRHLVTIQNALNTAKEQLVEYNSLLREVQDVAHLGFWELDLKENSLYWSDAVYRIFGLEPQQSKATFETFLSYVHPEDRDMLVREYEGSIMACRTYSIVHRILHKNGAVRYVEERCRHTYDSEGNAVKSIGTVYDITERIADQYKLQRLFDLQCNIVIQTDGKMLKRANRSMLHFFGFDSIEQFSERYPCICEHFDRNNRFFHLGKLPDDSDWIEALQALPTKERIVSMTDALQQPHAFNVSINHFEDDDYIVVFTDISETILEQFSLEQRVSRDHLTGAYSRDFFDTHIDTLIEKALKRNRALGVILFDIDHFKSVDDTFGHDVGDKVLKHLVVTVKYSIRDEDFLFRWGGDEFLLIAETESDENLKRMTEHIRQRVEHEPFTGVKRLTCSFGTALHVAGEPIERTVKRADMALYKAKESGRNLVVQSQA